MTSTARPEDLVGAAEIADRLGLANSQLVHVWRRRHADFPAPVVELKRAHVWLWPEVERWARFDGTIQVNDRGGRIICRRPLDPRSRPLRSVRST